MIKVEHLSKKFGDLEVLKDVNAEIKKGEIISIIGPSGTGKSTFLRCLNLLDPPTGGHIYINGQEITAPGANVNLLRQKMGMVFQDFNLFAHLNILDNLTLAPVKLLGKTRAEAEERGRELLHLVGLAAKEKAFPSELSGGQKQRVAIARCLAMDPAIILFDEPTSALDPTMVSEVLGVIRRLAQTGLTMAIVTHEMQFAKDVSTRIFFMNDGIIYEEGTPDQVFNHPQKDATRAFINRIRSLEYTIADYDHYDMFELGTAVSLFCEKHFLDKKQKDAVLHLIEETLQLSFGGRTEKETTARRDLVRDEGGILLTVSYSEKTNQIITRLTGAASLGTIFNKEADPDGLGVMIINGLTKGEAQERRENGRIIFELPI
ncbi:MAG: amino acid ABC transporter ATP-binding protein [Bacteroidales bacterium]|jgi:polar amino acid transport system ATP-binding protein|nr:amino acid ABC transporter ATP-binding protein [Bacteroidales bacterium]